MNIKRKTKTPIETFLARKLMNTKYISKVSSKKLRGNPRLIINLKELSVLEAYVLYFEYCSFHKKHSRLSHNNVPSRFRLAKDVEDAKN